MLFELATSLFLIVMSLLPHQSSKSDVRQDHYATGRQVPTELLELSYFCSSS